MREEAKEEMNNQCIRASAILLILFTTCGWAIGENLDNERWRLETNIRRAGTPIEQFDALGKYFLYLTSHLPELPDLSESRKKFRIVCMDSEGVEITGIQSDLQAGDVKLILISFIGSEERFSQFLFKPLAPRIAKILSSSGFVTFALPLLQRNTDSKDVFYLKYSDDLLILRDIAKFVQVKQERAKFMRAVSREWKGAPAVASVTFFRENRDRVVIPDKIAHIIEYAFKWEMYKSAPGYHEKIQIELKALGLNIDDLGLSIKNSERTSNPKEAKQFVLINRDSEPIALLELIESMDTLTIHQVREIVDGIYQKDVSFGDGTSIVSKKITSLLKELFSSD